MRSLKPYKRNPRTHTKKQIGQIADSIRTFGWTNPILIDADNCVMAGHGRLEAAKFLGIDRVPTIRIEDMTEAQKRAYILADNKLAENAGWDRELLALELQGLLEMDLDFEVTMTGFEMGEIDVLIGDLNAGADDEADEVPEIDPALPPLPRSPAIFGSLAGIACYAPMRPSRNRLSGSWAASWRRWSSPIRPTTCPLTGMSAASVR